MSALGHKQTYAVQNGMSALPPIADICSAQAHVRFVPKADIVPLIEKPNCRPRARFPSRFEIAAQDCMSNDAILPSSSRKTKSSVIGLPGLTWRA